MFFYDVTYILVILGMLLCMLASAYVNSTMSKYKRQFTAGGLTGEQAARRILMNEGLHDVQVMCLNESGGDHYDPRTRTVKLSYDVYTKSSVTAIAVAAHECGHAIQHSESYLPMSLRSALVPVVNIASNLGIPLILLGVLLSWNQVLIQIGILAFASALLFQLVTLPVEFNASHRALVKVGQYGMLQDFEMKGARKVLTSAAFTYVAATAASALQLLRLVLLFGGGSRRKR